MTSTLCPQPSTKSQPLGRRAGWDAIIRVAAVSALWSVLLLVAYWRDADGGMRELTGATTGLTSVGRLSSLVASVLLLTQVVLMARVPTLEAAFGQDQLARQHRLVGFTSFNLMLLHIVTITLGYAGVQVTQVPTTLWDLILTYPGMLLAVAATVCLCLVDATAAFVIGDRALDWLAARPGRSGLVVWADGRAETYRSRATSPTHAHDPVSPNTDSGLLHSNDTATDKVHRPHFDTPTINNCEEHL